MTTTDPLFGMFLALAASPDQQVSPLVQLIPFALVLAIFYFVILMPMKKRQKKVQEFLSALKVGDRVVTARERSAHAVVARRNATRGVTKRGLSDIGPDEPALPGLFDRHRGPGEPPRISIPRKDERSMGFRRARATQRSTFSGVFRERR